MDEKPHLFSTMLLLSELLGNARKKVENGKTHGVLECYGAMRVREVEQIAKKLPQFGLQAVNSPENTKPNLSVNLRSLCPRRRVSVALYFFQL